jgi:hypothetical protein
MSWTASTGEAASALHFSIKHRAKHEVFRALAAKFATFVALCLAAALTGCSDAQHVTLGTCGNRVVEQGEDCDGARGCNNACRYSCRTSASCPSGWGCDAAAGICRAAAGTFRAVTLATDRRTTLLAGDFDQDGRDDLLSFQSDQGELSNVYRFGADGSPARTLVLPAAYSAAIADMTGDRVPDVVLDGESVLAYRAAPPLGFSPLVGALRRFTSAARLVAVDLGCDGLRELLLLGGDADGAHALSRIGNNGVLTPVPGAIAISAAELLSLEAGDGLVPEPKELAATGAFARPGARACEMLALPAPVGTPAIDVYASRDGGETVERFARVAYDATAAPRRVFFADVDGDSISDLVIASSTVQQVSRGLGGGGFESKASALPEPDELLAAGDLDGVPGAELFTGLGNGPPYRQARILDVTNDGLADVIAAGDAERLDVLRNSRSGRQSLLPIPTRGVPRVAGAADFDGDGFDDLLIGAHDGSETFDRRASILFAPVTGNGAVPVEAAFFAHVAQLAAGIFDVDAFNADASADIGVLFSTEMGATQLAILEGGADRLLRSRLPSGDPQFQAYVPGGPALGRFEAQAGLEVAVVAVRNFGGPPVVDLLKVGSDGLTFLRSVPLDAPVYAPPPTSARGGIFALNLNGDDLDELYVTSAGGVSQLVADGGGFKASSFLASGSLLEVVPQDADGDGLQDLIVVDRDHGLTVYLARRNSPPERHRFPPEAFDCPQLGPDVAFLQADADAGIELLFNCYPRSVHLDFPVLPPSAELLGLGADMRIFDVDFQADTLTRVGGVPGTITSRFVTGDFNGDGVTDVAGSAPDLVVLFGDPR